MHEGSFNGQQRDPFIYHCKSNMYKNIVRKENWASFSKISSNLYQQFSRLNCGVICSNKKISQHHEIFNLKYQYEFEILIYNSANKIFMVKVIFSVQTETNSFISTTNFKTASFVLGCCFKDFYKFLKNEVLRLFWPF